MQYEEMNAGLAGARFEIGHDRQGRWLVHDSLGLVGGLFCDRTSAIKFAMEVCERHREQIHCLPDAVILDTNAIFAKDRSAEDRKAA